MRFEDLSGRIVIWGAGREGIAAYAELQQRGLAAEFALTGDGAGLDGLTPDLAGVTTTGQAALELLTSADVVIKSPGVPHSSPEYATVHGLGIPITSLTDLWLSTNPRRVLAVTGTKGKSTTSSLVHHLLLSVDITAALVGNGGTPVTAAGSTGDEVAVVEVSSYQAAELTVSPRVVVITSLYPEHLPWHGGYEQYVSDKLNLVAHGCDVVVVPDLDGEIARLVRARAGRVRAVDPGSLGITMSEGGIDWDGVGRLDAREVPIRGAHNLANVALALTAVAAGFELSGDHHSRLLRAIPAYSPLAHRLELVTSNDGRRWVDDGLATAPEAVVAALQTYPDERIALVLGGADRGLSFEPLRDYLRSRTHVDIVAVGPAGVRWMQEGGGDHHSRLADSFAEAMAVVRSDLAGCDLVLLSPGAPSFDEFVSYEERSAAFRRAAVGDVADLSQDSGA